jgi:hypothetical protein
MNQRKRKMFTWEVVRFDTDAGLNIVVVRSPIYTSVKLVFTINTN